MDARFLQYSPPSVIRDFVLAHIEPFLDGEYWDDVYSDLNLGSETATNAAKKEILTYYAGLLADAVWLAEQGEAGLADSSRDRLLRASASIQILSMGGSPLSSIHPE